MTSKEKKRQQDEFTNKIVLLGSTAPSLFDIKPTPMSRLHPGVEILATAIDNLKHGDYLRYPAGRILYPLLSLLIVWATAWAFYRNVGRGQIDRLFGAWQVILLAVSYASINLTNTYINLTGPVMVGLAYFSVARIYAAASSNVLETNVLRVSMEREGELGAFLLLIRVGGPDRSVGEGALEGIRRRLEKAGSEPKSVEMLRGRQKGIWALLENTLAVSWVIPARDQAARERVSRDIEGITASLPAMVRARGDPRGHGATWVVQEGLISGGTGARADWGALFAEAQLRWHQAAAHDGGSTT
jgi:hypothetical protein